MGRQDTSQVTHITAPVEKRIKPWSQGFRFPSGGSCVYTTAVPFTCVCLKLLWATEGKLLPSITCDIRNFEISLFRFKIVTMLRSMVSTPFKYKGPVGGAGL